MRLHYISNLPADLRGGGYSLRNAAAFEALSEAFGARYRGPFTFPPGGVAKLISASRRRLGLHGTFHHFAPGRLSALARAVRRSQALEADLVFFNGFTPWIHTVPEGPYIAWNDCSFHDYVRIYHDPARFDPLDLARIESREAQWLRGARAVILRSRHFADRTITQYELDPARVFSLRNFSTMAPPKADTYSGAPLFLFMSTHFVGKNGPVVLDAFARLRARYPQARLAVVGDIPAAGQRSTSKSVDWIGFLDPRDPAQDTRKRELLASAAMLVHPTSFDTNPAVLVEAAYFGCPAISTRAFAIPEIIEHGKTGWLVNDPRDADALAARMVWALEATHPYFEMRRAARNRALERMTLSRFKADLTKIVAGCNYGSASTPGTSVRPNSPEKVDI
ncbi:Glycosyl transferases group 1 [Roseivivax jejudonensis]|uniref:Glycosyl transferases group 1 n=1 Tax=Roseivivax jejudonensis TaxID=1529041 RepID=A0A1X6Y673_9RHOB|nr:glycosyltransferase family 4 protein [Roseivivax jejudonensis]SLN11561.1 Glycosyl transferases group 1 [Roseivivax jejudonensis]